ncbi:hypothetical protein AB1Y20_021052 [Prymnesium parvum]|uniref:Dienelactone hydrolase domain-containing protein n=1 Tax=Prymnesium parvum TaxID=97485 RepID=A0AB34JKY2_PRYPA
MKLLVAALLLPPAARRAPPPRAASPPPPPPPRPADVARALNAHLPPDDPIHNATLFLSSAEVSFPDGAAASARGFCATYLPLAATRSHSRALLLLAPAPPASLRPLTERLALGCECVALLPTLDGPPARWTHATLAAEALAASRHLLRAHGVSHLGVLAFGAACQPALELLADGGIEAHAAVLLCPHALRGAARAARALELPLLAVCTRADDAAELREGLQLNARLGGDFFVAEFAGCADEFALAPRDEAAREQAERAFALMQAWFDRHVPEV